MTILENLWYNVYHDIMDTYSDISEDRALKFVGLELMFMTPEKHADTNGISAVELAKLLEMPVDTVKKKLKILNEKGIVSVRGINPKLWKFDEYNFQRLDDDDEIFQLLCSFDDVDFERYFSY